MEDETGKLNHVQQALVQAFIHRRTMDTDTLVQTWTRLLGKEQGTVSQRAAEVAVSACNVQLIPFDLEIKQTRDQNNGHVVWAFVNTMSDGPMQLGTLFSADQVKFFRLLLDEMFDLNNDVERGEVMAVPTTAALNLVSKRREQELQKMKKADIQDLMDDYVKQGWLEKSEKGYLSLTPRALAELQPYLVETFNSGEEDDASNDKVHSCFSCKNLVTVGKRCANRDCSLYLHNYCQRIVGPNLPCPSCKTAWNNVLEVGEAAAR